MLVKLWSIGVTDSLWLDRFQYVIVNGQHSEFLPGSILGPLLFLVYINDFPSTIKFVLAFLFADDNTKCYMRIKTTGDILHLQKTSIPYSHGVLRIILLLNPPKCVFMQVITSYHINSSH